MSPTERRDKGNNNYRTAKAIDAIPIAGIVVSALLLLSALSVVGSYNLAHAQPNMTAGGGNATTSIGATGENVTSTAGGVNLS